MVLHSLPLSSLSLSLPHRLSRISLSAGGCPTFPAFYPAVTGHALGTHRASWGRLCSWPTSLCSLPLRLPWPEPPRYSTPCWPPERSHVILTCHAICLPHCATWRSGRRTSRHCWSKATTSEHTSARSSTHRHTQTDTQTDTDTHTDTHTQQQQQHTHSNALRCTTLHFIALHTEPSISLHVAVRSLGVLLGVML